MQCIGRNSQPSTWSDRWKLVNILQCRRYRLELTQCRWDLLCMKIIRVNRQYRRQTMPADVHLRNLAWLANLTAGVVLFVGSAVPMRSTSQEVSVHARMQHCASNLKTFADALGTYNNLLLKSTIVSIRIWSGLYRLFASQFRRW